MVVRASGLGMEICRFSRPQRGVGVLATPDATVDTTQRVESFSEVPPGAGVLPLRVPGMAVGGIIDRPSVTDRFTVTH
jgi:hypothetical protein